MFCPHCSNRIPDGSNICPICYANLAGVKAQPVKNADAQQQDGTASEEPRPRVSKKAAYSKGSRGARKSADRTPLIIAFGLILLLIVIIAMIVRSMFTAGDSQQKNPAQNPTQQQQQQSATGDGQQLASNFVVFGATSTPAPRVTTPVPQVAVTPEPATPAPVSYNTLKKGSIGPEVVTLQQALAELGYLSGAADGNFGTGTQNAVKQFQEDNDLAADGIAGKMTLELLYTKSSVTPIPETTVGPDDILNLPG